MSKLNVLTTVFNEEDFLEYSLKSCIPYVENIVVVEGSYQESIKIGASLRSNDKTIEIAKSLPVHFIQANEKSDPEQRNVGLEYIKNNFKNEWFLIVDGDEIYAPETFKLINSLIQKMEANDQYASYFTSLTFVNDFKHYTKQEFPRLFKITKECKFVNDNFLSWPDKSLSWSSPHVIKTPYIQFFHYSFCKSKERFKMKKEWWENRFQEKFNYSWNIDKFGKINDPGHKIFEFIGKHPDIMKTHKLWKESYEK